MSVAPSASCSITARLSIINRPGMLGRVAVAAVVVLAALLNALRLVRKELRRLRVVVTGVGAAGTATIKILQSSGVRDIIGVAEHGIIHRGRARSLDFMKRWMATSTNPRGVTRGLAPAMKGADVFIGPSLPGILTVRELRLMARTPSCSPWPILFPRSSRKRPRSTSGSWPPDGRTTRTRSTTCCAFSAFSEACSTRARGE